MDNSIVDLQIDTGFSRFMEIAGSGRIDGLDTNTDLDSLIEKQAYADDESFADMSRRQFSIASALETELSARYAEKCASCLPRTVIDRIDEACAIFGVEKVSRELSEINTTNEMFTAAAQESEKYASATEYGSELDLCLSARAALFPDNAEDFEEMSKLASVIAPQDMVELIKEADATIGADLPWILQRVGSAEYAVFEKRASGILVDLGEKLVSFEKLAEMDEVLADIGVTIDFDAHDPYTIKEAVEKLPTIIKTKLASVID